ncbi:MAG TPA: dihydrolipoamide acetyltransferase family protein [Actinomycetota bacterium]|jgi:pyruvate dehydrogenase E2 component (dihydrolipoamide acetyltransferase)|nr:dihydrolipoamide acetyltransferase family protein [Actinomycetota bacterium]
MERIFSMPDLGEGLEEGRIVEWLVGEGEDVVLNQPLVEVETAKAAVEIPSPFAGKIVVLHGAVDADVPVGSPLITFDVDGTAELPPEPGRQFAYAPVAEQPDGSAPRATPPVRKLAKELGVDISTVIGSGPDGRVTEADVLQAVPLQAAAYTDEPEGDIVRQRILGRRDEIADVLTRQSAIPQVTTFRTVDCSALDALRRELGVSPLPVFIAALVRTVADHRTLNDGWVADHVIEHRKQVNVGVAVDAPEGLIVPVIRDAGSRGIREVATEIERLAAAARDGHLHPDELTTATIAVSNTGSYGSEAGTPILSPGTSVTIALGVIQPRPLVIDGAVVARLAAMLSMTFDHRVLDGATAGRALTDLVSLLESPERLGGLPR